MYQYCRLVTYSTGLQRVVQAGKLKDDVTFLPGVSRPSYCQVIWRQCLFIVPLRRIGGHQLRYGPNTTDRIHPILARILLCTVSVRHCRPSEGEL